MRALRRLALAATAAGAGVLAAAAISGADPPTGTVTSYAVPSANAEPTGLIDGPDANLWFVEPATGVDNVGSMTPGGTATEYPATLFPDALASGVSGTASAQAVWLIESNADIGDLASITPPSTTVQGVTSVGHLPVDIAADASGNLWITDQTHIAEVVPPYHDPDEADVNDYTPQGGGFPVGARPESIVAGPVSGGTQTMWFTVTGAGTDEVASISETGTITQYPLPVSGQPGNIVLGPDGNLWVGVVPPPVNSDTLARLVLGPYLSLSLGALQAAANETSYVVRITGSGPNVGTMTAFPLPAGSNANPDVLGSGPDGQLWMADGTGGNGDLTAVTTSGTFTDYPGILPAGDSITAIARDPTGADTLYVTDSTANTVDRIPLQPPPAPTPTTTTTTTTQTQATPSPPTLTVTEAPASAVTTTDATLSGTIAEPTGSASTSVTYQFQYGTTTDYGSSSPMSTATATTPGTPVTASVSGLEPYTTYHYRLVASDCTAASCQSTSADRSFTTGSTLQPVMSTAVGVAPTGGTILIKLRGHHTFTRLRAGELIPVGATIDARHGTILIQSSIGPGEVASGRFSSGIFTVTQPAGGTVTVLVLLSSLSVCPGHPHTQAALAHAATSKPKKKKKKTARQSHKVVNQVFGNAHGQFSTQGNYATAADEGTAWRIADRCDGTQIAVLNGEVTVTNRITHRHFVLTAGHHHLIPR